MLARTLMSQAACPALLMPEQHTQVSTESTAGAFFVGLLVRRSLLLAGGVPSPQIDEFRGNELTFADKEEKKFENLQQWMQYKC